MVEPAEKWTRRMLISPPVNCPVCKRNTRAEDKCQWCKTEWSKEQLKVRDKQRVKTILASSEDPLLDTKTRDYLKKYVKLLMKHE